MKGIIAFSTVTEDDFWQSQCDGLRDSLAKFGIEHIRNTVKRPRCDEDKESKYRMSDFSFIEFAEQETRRILLLDAEIRMHRPLPQEWVDSDANVITYNIPNRKDDINNGQCIWNREGVRAFRKAMDIVAENNLPQEAVEYNTIQWLPPHIHATISLDRFAAPEAHASRGYWVGNQTIFTHPYIDGLTTRPDIGKDFYNKMPMLRHRDFINHFSPDDERIARLVYDRLINCDPTMWRLDELPFERVTDISADPPGNLHPAHPKKNALVYKMMGWKMCPALGLVSPESQWSTIAWKMIGI